MEIDTGASLSIMSEQEFLNLWPERSVVATDVTLHSYSGECIPVVGSVDVCVSYKGQKITLPLVIVRGVGPRLLGRIGYRICSLIGRKYSGLIMPLLKSARKVQFSIL